MSGHSKWSQIKHKKGTADAKKGQLFSKLVREITIAARTGGTSPEANPRLRAAIERARVAGLPKDNIERALSRASGGGEGEALEEFLYEAAKSTVQILIEGITDNKNRTLNEIKQILSRHGAKLVPPGSFLWNFEKIWTEEGRDYRPKNFLEVSAEERGKIVPLLDELVEQDDVQEVYTNLKKEILNPKS